jgi:hypothetical protein
MGLTNFEGFENYASLANVSPVLNMPYSNGLVPTLTNSAIINSQNITTKDNISSSHKFLRITTNFYAPQVNVPFKKNIEHGIVGFSFFPILPSGGKYGDVGDEYGYSPIAFLTNEVYKPSLAICVNASGQVYLSKYLGADILYSDSSYNTKDWNISHGPHFSTPARERNPFYFSLNYFGEIQYLNTTPNPSVATVLPYIANTKNTNNRLYFGYWNYIEIEFDLRNNKEEFKIRINRNETSSKLDAISTYSVGIGAPLSGITNFTGSGTVANIGTRTTSSAPSSFKVMNAGSLNIVASGYTEEGWGATALYRNGQAIASPSFFGILNVFSGDVISFFNSNDRNGDAFTAYFLSSISPRHRYASNIAFGQNRFLGVQSTSGWNTLIDDVYIIDCEDGLSPSGFLGPIACRKTNFNTTITNTAGSGTLAQASETFAGTTSLLDSIIFDRLNQSGVFRNTSFSSSESGIKEEVIAIQNTTYGFSINSNDYVEYSVLQQGSGLPLRSGVLGTNRIDGGLIFSPIYTTLPNGVALSGLSSDSGIQELQYLFIAKSNEEE